MDTEPSVSGAVSVARIPGAEEVYLITRMAAWDGAVLPVVLGHARTREAAVEFARREAAGGSIWIDDSPKADSFVQLRRPVSPTVSENPRSQAVRRGSA